MIWALSVMLSSDKCVVFDRYYLFALSRYLFYEMCNQRVHYSPVPVCSKKSRKQQ